MRVLLLQFASSSEEPGSLSEEEQRVFMPCHRPLDMNPVLLIYSQNAVGDNKYI